MNKMNRMNRMILPVLCAVILLSGGCSQAAAGDAAGRQAGMPSGATMTAAVSVETSVIKKTGIADTLTYNGTVNYADSYQVIPEVSGEVEAIYFDVGERVNAGAVLFAINSKDIRLQITNYETNITNAEISVENAEIKILDDEMNLKQAETSLLNTEQLFEAGGASQSELDGARDSYTMAQRTLESSKLSLRQAEQSLVNAEHQLQSARSDLSATNVKSPISGVVATKNVELGSIAGSSSAYMIVNTDSMTVEAGITEQLAATLKQGDNVSVTFSSLNGESFNGELISISPVTDDSGTYPVKIAIDNESDRIRAGMSAEIKFTKTSNESAFVVSKDSILTDENGNFVYTVIDGTAHKTAVETGIDTGAESEITSGLSEGDVVIVKGQNYVTEGSPVNDINDPSDDAATDPSGAEGSESAQPQNPPAGGGFPEGAPPDGERPSGGPGMPGGF